MVLSWGNVTGLPCTLCKAREKHFLVSFAVLSVSVLPVPIELAAAVYFHAQMHSLMLPVQNAGCALIAISWTFGDHVKAAS